MATKSGRTTESNGPGTATAGEPGVATQARADKPTGTLPQPASRDAATTTASGGRPASTEATGGRKRRKGSAGRKTTPAGKARQAKVGDSTHKESRSKEIVPVPESVTDGAALVGAAAADIGSFIRAQREAAEVSIRQLAERAGVSNPYLSQIERGLRNPSAEVLGQSAKGLRMSAEVLYARAGILELRAGSAVRDAILTAPELSERQREVLVDIYESFRANNALNADTVVDVD